LGAFPLFFQKEGERGNPEIKKPCEPPAVGRYRYNKCIHAYSPRFFLPWKFYPEFLPWRIGPEFFCVGIDGKVVQKGGRVTE